MIINNISSGNTESSASLGVSIYGPSSIPDVTSLTFLHSRIPGVIINNSAELQTLNWPNLYEITKASFDLDGNSSLTSVSIPLLRNLVEHFRITNNTALPIFNAESLNLVVGIFTISGNTSLTTLNLSALTEIDDVATINNPNLTSLDLSSLIVADSDFSIISSSLATINLPSVTTINGPFVITNNNVLTTITCPFLNSFGDDISIKDNPLLTTLVFSSSLHGSGNMDFTNNALDQSSIDNLLVAFSVGDSTDGVFDSTGGTNATTSSLGTIATAVLEGRGWTITTN